MKLKHPLCFRSNIGKPSSLLLNRLFDIRNIDAGGDCGVLCLLYAFLSTSTNIQNEISKNIDIYMRNHWLSNYVEEQDIQIFTMSGIRHALLYAKLDYLKDYPILESINEDSFHQNSDGEQKEIYGYLIDHFDNLMKAKKENDKAMIVDLFQQMKKKILRDSTVAHPDDIYWMTDVDMFLITTLTNGLICSLCVRDMNDPNENNEDDFISDWGYANYCKKAVLKSS